ncbi:MAG: ABC transporter ATP-binding protein [Bacteroidetes bacterium]|nr:ABC transporter ATP-binding protein [Bacteroidota bacterium]
MSELNIRNISKTYDQVQAVKNLSLTIEKGEVFGLLGHNGAGKTTTIECILGIKKTDAGTVSLLGMDPNQNRKELFTRVGVQFQESAYQERIKVHELCGLFTALYSKPLSYKDLLAEFGLMEKEKAYVSSLSGGQRQKLTVILALIPDPEILFLDELTTGLDPQARREMWAYIRKLKEMGKTIFMTTHYMEEAETLCNRVGLMRRGELTALGSPRELIDSCNLDHHITITTDHENLDFLKEMPGVRDVQKLQDSIEIRTSPDTSLLAVIRNLDERKIHIHTLNMRTPNLDDAYLHLTGINADGVEVENSDTMQGAVK